jgi:RHS repeat-associated protein
VPFTYEDMLPVLVAERKTGQREPDAHQYLWGPGQREAVMAILPKARVEGGEDRASRRYHLHQNRQLNVFAASILEVDIVRAFGISDYADFGESATYVRIMNVETVGMQQPEGSNPTNALNGILRDKQYVEWNWQRDRASRRYALLLTLEHEAVLKTLNIWHTGFPNTFEVFIPEARLNENESISRYMERLLHQYDDKRLRVITEVVNGQYRQGQAPVIATKSRDDPYRLDLGRTKGRHVLLVWNEPVDLSVIQFEVLAYNQPASSLGFAGAWLDAETGLLYQGARYRLPEMGGKFISPDPLGFIAGHNLYAYANNDPLTYFDPHGEAPHVLIGAGVGAGLGAGFYAWQVLRTDEEWNWAKFGIYTGAGALSGAAAAATFGLSTAGGTGGWVAGSKGVIAAAKAGAVGGGIHGAVTAGGITAYETGDWRHALGDALLHGGIGALSGAVGGAAGGAILNQFAGFNNALAKYIASGIGGGFVGGGIGGGLHGGMTIDGWSWGAAGHGAFRGAWQGAVVGGAMGAVGYGIERASAPRERHHLVPWNNKQYKHGAHPLVRQGGINLKNDPANLTPLIGHESRHSSSYHSQIQQRLDAAYVGVAGKGASAANQALNDVYSQIGIDINRGALRPYDNRRVWIP